MNEIDWKRMGMRIRDVRQQRSISQKELADLIGLRECSLSNIELSKRRPSLEVLIEIILILDVSMDYIVRGIRPVYGSNGLIFRSDDELEQRFLLTEE